VKQTNLFLAACIFAMGAHASIITLDSSAASTSNNSGQATINIEPNPAWAAALPNSSWISNGLTGNPSQPGYVVYPNGTTVTFSESFYLTGPVTAATLTVLADDTTSVILNGQTLTAATELPESGYPTCSSQPIGCLSTTAGTFGLAQLDPYLKTGENTIQFGVVQKALVSFGLDYAGSITTASTVPEPTSLGLIGAGLVLIAIVSRRMGAH
jgi:hypothetical protein